MRRGKNQDSDATVQQGDESTMVQQDDASTIVNAQSTSVPDGGNLGNNTTQEHSVMDPNSSMLSELGSRAPRFGSYTANEFSPIHNQVASPTRSIVPPETNPSTPPRLNTSGNNEVMITGMNLLDAQGVTDSGTSVVGTHIPALSPRRSTQSPVTHQLQQMLRNSASKQVCAYSPSSDSGNGASAFSNWEANNSPTIVETVPEGDSDNDDQWLKGQWPEGDSHAEDLADDAQVDLSTRQSSAPTETGEKYDSGLQELVIVTNDPGRADFVISVGALGNASGTPLDGSQNMLFGERTVDKKRVIDGNNDNKGMLVCSGSESSTSYNAPSGFDPSDPDVIADLMTRPPMADPRSPITSTILFNEQVAVAEYKPNGSPCSGVAATLTGNLGRGANSPSSSLPGSDALCQHANTGGSSNSNGSPNSSDGWNSDGSNGNNSNQGGTSNGNDPQGPDPSGNNLNKLVFTYSTAGGALQHWGIEGTIRVAEVVQITGASIPQIRSTRHLIRPKIVDRVTDKMHYVYRHNDRNRVRAIINGMSIFVLKVPNARMTPGNVTMLEDYVASSQELCRILSRHLAYANALPPDQLPLRVPLLLYAE